MHILMIADSAPPIYGGAGKQAALLADALNERGVDVRIYARQKVRVESSRSYSIKFSQPFFSSRKLSKALFAFTAFTRVLFSKADIVHIHGVYEYAISAAIAAHIRKIPVVLKVTLVGSDDPAHLSKTSFGKLKTHPFHLASSVIALSPQIEEILRNWDSTLRIENIPNGVSIPSHINDQQKENTVVFAGDVGVRKGADLLLQAWQLASPKIPDYRLQLAGPWNLNSTQSNELDSNKIEYLGLLSPDALEQLYYRSKIFAFPSRQEGLPNALIEAMAFGLACVASDIPENTATAGEAATYFESSNIEALADALVHAVSNQNQLSQVARKRSLAFAIEEVRDRYIQLYSSLIKKQ